MNTISATPYIVSNKKLTLSDPDWVRYILIGLALSIIGLFLVFPLAIVLIEAFSKGWSAYSASLTHPDALSAMRLTLLVAAVAVPLTTVFGISAAWAIARFDFRGKSLLITLIDEHDIKIIFAVPGIILATLFVTFPFVARELIPLMQEMGHEEEEAALSLGATGWQTFFKITLPNIKWALLTGVLLCNARAMGEFGAVSVVSGHIRGLTNTLPLHIEVSYNEYDFVGAFAGASLLAALAIVTLVFKTILEWKQNQDLKAARQAAAE
ncbi:MAG: sulfate transport system permease protein [Methylococcaceae bacterium NSP1-1]|nr:MAG: sulfate transport system permease protein [Methylococcaceae bacterium NSP1-1]